MLFCLAVNAADHLEASNSLLPENHDPKAAGDRVLRETVTITGAKVKGAHDSDFIIAGGKAYVVFMANDRQAGEDPTWPFVYCALNVVDLATRQVEQSITFAAGEHEYSNAALPPGACFVPRILQHSATTLRCFFASEQPGIRQSQVWRIDYDVTKRDFAWRIDPVELETSTGAVPLQPQSFHDEATAHGLTRAPSDYGVYMIDSFKNFDGAWHAVLNNFPSGQLAWARLDENHERFTVLGNFFLPNDKKTTESAVERLPNGSWLAVSRQEDGDRNCLFSESPDGTRWKPHAARSVITNGTNSKTILHRFGDVYYLGWQEATQIDGVGRSVFNVDVSRDGRSWRRKYRFETPRSFQYPVFREHLGTIYFTVTQGDTDPSRKERIMFGVLE